jgi:hypothetical protein
MHVTAVAIPYIGHHGDPHVFPAGVAVRKRLQDLRGHDPVLRQPVPPEARCERPLEEIEPSVPARRP